jgi:hypothetical protein
VDTVLDVVPCGVVDVGGVDVVGAVGPPVVVGTIAGETELTAGAAAFGTVAGVSEAVVATGWTEAEGAV